MSIKKISLSLLSAAALVGLVACGGTSSEDKGPKDVTLKVWVPSEEGEVMEQIIANFKEAEKTAHPNINYTIEIQNIAEGDSRTELEKDPSAAADVLATTDDSCLSMAAAGEVYQIPANSQYYKNVTTLNATGSVQGVTYNGGVYGFPETADNGYFLYYNSNFVTDVEAKSFDKLVEKATSLNKSFYFDYSNGWYAVSYLNCNGGTIGNDANGPYSNWKETALAPLKAMYALAAQPGLVAQSGNDQIIAGMQSGEVIAAFTGTWNYTALSAIDGVKCAECPTLKVNNVEKHMSSFSGGKVVCVNKVTANPTEAMRFADFMTNETSQMIRFNKRSIGPSNINAASSEAVAANPALQALAKQGAYAISQSATLNKAMNSVFWDAAGGLGAHMKTQDWATEDAMVAALNTVVDTIVNAK